MISSNIFSLTSLLLAANLTFSGTFSNMYSANPCFLGMKSTISNSINLHNFKSFYNSAPLLKGTFSHVTLSNVHVSNSMQAVNINNEFIENSLDYYMCRVTITKSVFDNCFIEGDEHHGGAIEFESCQVVISESQFIYCFASHGGAIYANYSKINIYNTNFTSNSAVNFAGAMLLVKCNFTISGGLSWLNSAFYHAVLDIHESSGHISSHHLYNNTAYDDCAGINIHESNVTLSSMFFVHNHAAILPGALQIEEGDYEDSKTQVTVNSCTFVSNEAEDEPINIQVIGRVEGSISNCVFDVHPEEAVFVWESPNFKVTNNRMSIHTKIPFSSIINNHMNIIDYEMELDHSRSDKIAIFLVFGIPAYLAVIFLCLVKIK